MTCLLIDYYDAPPVELLTSTHIFKSPTTDNQIAWRYVQIATQLKHQGPSKYVYIERMSILWLDLETTFLHFIISLDDVYFRANIGTR